MSKPKTFRYIAPEALKFALEGAMHLGQPLLLTGEPGTGKTQSAYWVLQYLQEKKGGFYPEVLAFHTKTSSSATDLFYRYDALSHFQSANLRKEERSTEDFISLQALGKAIAMSNPRPEYRALFDGDESMPDKPLSTVVLIDEIDKAPRDFTNDILDEIDNKRFFLKELGLSFEKGEEADIVVIMTSNSEKNLPDAFLRRCAFFHIDFPKGDALRQIVEANIGRISPETKEAYDDLLKYFEQVREASVRKKPATAELIGWLRLLELDDYFSKSKEGQRKLLEYNLSFLVKTREDLEAVRKKLLPVQKN